jgi:hypothetical protein
MRIAAVSDLHGYLPPLPECDLLIIAGDVCPDRFGGAFPDVRGQREWMAYKFQPWLKQATSGPVAATWGNHDFAGQRDWPFAHFVTDALVTAAGLSVWLSPWSNTFGGWAFMKPAAELGAIYRRIPDGTDIIVSHQPPYGYGDTVDPRYVIGDADIHCGSRELLKAIERVRPKLVICGHIHGGFGRYEHDGIPIYNVSVVNEQYELVNAATVIELPDVDGGQDKPSEPVQPSND